MITGIQTPFLIEKLQKLDALHRVVFSAACCERLLPNYTAFHKEENWGDPNVLRLALDRVWECLEDGELPKEGLDQLISDCNDIIPDTENFSTPLVSYALDAGTAVVSTLECCKNGRVESAVEVAVFSRDTVFMALSAQGWSDDKMADSPLMKRELEKQEEDLDVLLEQQELTTALVLRFRHAWESQNCGLSNINL